MNLTKPRDLPFSQNKMGGARVPSGTFLTQELVRQSWKLYDFHVNESKLLQPHSQTIERIRRVNLVTAKEDIQKPSSDPHV